MVKRLRAEDCEAAAHLVSRFKGEITAAQIREPLSSDRNYLLVAAEAGAMVGFLYAHLLDRMDGRKAMFIYEIEISEPSRRKGHGSELIKTILEMAAEAGAVKAFVLRDHRNVGAVEFYKSTGGLALLGDDLLFTYPISN